MNHVGLIDHLARNMGLKNNHQGVGQKFQVGDTVRNFIPDMVDDTTFYEVEFTGNKDHYHDVRGKERVLIVGIQSFDAFDEVIIYKVSNPMEVMSFKKEAGSVMNE